MDPQTAVTTLINAGWSELRIAREAKTNQPTINRIKRGTSRDCMYQLGVRLVALAESALAAQGDGAAEAAAPDSAEQRAA